MNAAPPPATAPCILVVEDEMTHVMYLEDVLADLGCRALTAARLPEGLRLARTQPLAGAILDVSVAGMSVFPLVNELRSRGIPFAFLTGCEPDQLPVDFRAAPFLSKPVVAEQFAKVVAGFVAAARSLDPD